MSTAEGLTDAIARGDLLDMGDDPKKDDPPAAKDDPKAEDHEAKAEDEKGDEDKPKEKGEPRIPLSRHKELLQKERAQREALERQLQGFQRSDEVAETHKQLNELETSVLDMEKRYNKLMADGETERAAELMTKIRQTERQIVETKSEARIAAATAQAAEKARYDMALERIEEAYPVLDPNSDEYDQERMSDVAALMQGYRAQGLTPTQALQKAVKKLFPVTTSTQEKAITVQPRVTEKDIAAERKKLAAAKTADTVKSQAPNLGKVGEDNNRVSALTAKDVMEMDQATFAKLSEAELKKLRGDDL
jgi:hypothetical protein